MAVRGPPGRRQQTYTQFAHRELAQRQQFQGERHRFRIPLAMEAEHTPDSHPFGRELLGLPFRGELEPSKRREIGSGQATTSPDSDSADRAYRQPLHEEPPGKRSCEVSSLAGRPPHSGSSRLRFLLTLAGLAAPVRQVRATRTADRLGRLSLYALRPQAATGCRIEGLSRALRARPRSRSQGCGADAAGADAHLDDVRAAEDELLGRIISGGWKCAIAGVPWRGSASACLARGGLLVKQMFEEVLKRLC